MKIKARITMVLVVAFLFVGLSGIARAGINQWTTNGPYGGLIHALAVSPNYTNDHTIFAGSPGGVFKSTNGGASWTAVNTGITGNGLYSNALAVSPNYATDQTVYASGGGGVYKSTDGGTSWTAVNTGISNLAIYALAVSPNYATDNTVYAGSYGGGVFKSTNGGASWTAVNTGITSTVINALAISPNYATDGTVYAGDQGGVFKSTNGGASWTAVNTGIPNPEISALAVSPNYTTDNTVYAGSYSGTGGVYKSTNGGASWTAVNTGITNTAIWALAVSPNYATDQTVYAGCNNDGGVYKSTNGGASWTAVNTGITDITGNGLSVAVLAISPNYATDGTVYIGIFDGGVYKSTDGGASWTAVNTGITSTVINALAISPNYATDGTVYAGSVDGVYKSTNGGVSWNSVNAGIPNISVLAVSPNYASDQTIYAGRGGGVYKSTNGGASWTAVNTGISNLNIGSLAVSPNYAADQTIYAGSSGGGVFKSTNGGTNWTAVNTGITGYGLYIQALAVSPNYASDETVYAGSVNVGYGGGGVYKSANGGASWTAVNTGINSTNIYALAVSPNYATDQTVYAGSFGAGVYKSTNGGASWTAVNTGITNTNILALAVSPNYATDGTVYAGSNGAGVFKSTNGSASWTAVNIGIAVLYNYALAVSPNYAFDGTVYAGSQGGGAYSYTTDLLPPSSAITAPTNGAYIGGTSYTVTGTASDAVSGVQKVEVGITPNGGTTTWYTATGTTTWSYNWTLPADGSYTIQSRATDNANNVETPGTGVTVAVDNTPPAVSAGGDKAANAVFTQTATATDATSGVASVSWSKVSGPGTITFGTPTALSTTISANGDGTYVIQFTATDAAGNSASSTMTLTWDTTAPSSTITAPSGPYVSGTSCSISGTASDAVSGVQMVEVGITPSGGATTWYTANGTTSWSYSWTFPADGSYTIQSRATDAVGNVETPSAGVTVTVDNTTPTSSITAPVVGAILYGASSNITGTAVDSGPGVQKVEVGITPTGGTTAWYAATGTTSWSYSWTLPADGSYTIQTRATDNASRMETPGAGISVTVDNSSPVITAPADKAVVQAQFSPDPPIFSWVPNTCVKFKVAYSATPNFKKRVTVVSDNKGIGMTYNPSPASWNKITALGGNVFWRVAGTTLEKKVLYSASQEFTLNGNYSNISVIPSTDVNSIPTLECDPGTNSSVKVEFSASPYFTAPHKTPILTPGSLASYTPASAAWKTITKFGPQFYWRFMGKLSTGETTYSVTNTTSVTGGPTITEPVDKSTVMYPLTISWDTTGFVSFVVQASAAPDFSTKILALESTKTGSLELAETKWSKLSALGNPVYIRVVGTTEEKYTAYGSAVKVNIAQ